MHTYFQRRTWMVVCVLVIPVISFLLTGCHPYPSSKVPTPTVKEVQWNRPVKKNRPAPPIAPSRQHYSAFPREWLPVAYKEKQRRWDGIMIHHSALDSGDARSYDRAHKNRGWDGLGYHFVICNGNNGHQKGNGEIEVGWRWTNQREGAHCRVDVNDNNYWNEHTIGICLVGNFQRYRPSEAQWQSLVKLVHFLQQRYGIPASKIYGHRDAEATACPGKYLTIEELKRRLRQSSSGIYLTEKTHSATGRSYNY